MSYYTEQQITAPMYQHDPSFEQTVVPQVNPYAHLQQQQQPLKPSSPLATPKDTGRSDAVAEPALGQSEAPSVSKTNNTELSEEMNRLSTEERPATVEVHDEQYAGHSDSDSDMDDTHNENLRQKREEEIKAPLSGEGLVQNDGDDAKIIWAMQTKKGKPISLHVGGKLKQFQEQINGGCYMLYAFTTASLPGGDKGPRYVAVDVHVKLADGNTLVHEVYKLHSAEKTLAVDWIVPQGQTATVFMQFRLNSPIGPFKVMAKLFRREQPVAADGEELDENDLVYAGTSVDNIDSELRRQSEEKNLAQSNGMMRPFLILASMHPAARQQVADLLSMSIYGPELANDGHKESWELISKNRKGMQAKSMHSLESLNPVNWKRGNGSHWFQVVYRVMTEVHKREMSFSEEMKNIRSKDMEAAANSSNDPRMADMEIRLLHAIGETFLGQMEKDPQFMDRLNKLLVAPEVIDMQNRIRQTNVQDELVLRFVVAFSLYLLDQEQEQEAKKIKLRENEATKQEEMVQKNDEMSQHSEFLGSRDYPQLEKELKNDDEKPENFVAAIKNKLLLGHYDPRSAGQKGAAYAKKAGIFLGKKGLKHALSKYIIPVTIAPFFPPILPVWIIGNQVHKMTGSDHEKLYLVVVQLLLQRLLLAAHGIDISQYY